MHACDFSMAKCAHHWPQELLGSASMVSDFCGSFLKALGVSVVRIPLFYDLEDKIPELFRMNSRNKSLCVATSRIRACKVTIVRLESLPARS